MLIMFLRSLLQSLQILSSFFVRVWDYFPLSDEDHCRPVTLVKEVAEDLSIGGCQWSSMTYLTLEDYLSPLLCINKGITSVSEILFLY